jgi:hypothetical protein
MELNELILLAAAALRTDNNGLPESVLRREAVKEAKLLWAEVLKQDRER